MRVKGFIKRERRVERVKSYLTVPVMGKNWRIQGFHPTASIKNFRKRQHFKSAGFSLRSQSHTAMIARQGNLKYDPVGLLNG